MGIESTNFINPVKMQQFLVLLLVSSALAFPGGDHHGDGHDDKCVDISTYTEVTYNETVQPICCYQVVRNCQKKSKNVCITTPTTECHAEAYTVCNSVSTVAGVYHDDITVTESFVPKKCFQNEVHSFEEVKKKAVCEDITKSVCDSKWEINEAGEKVWAGDENCRDVTWENCELKPYTVITEVPIYNCEDDTPITYVKPVIAEADVTTVKTTCEPRAVPVCVHTAKTACAVVEWEDCQETVDEKCMDMYIREPSQGFDHRLKCIGGHH